MDHKAQYINYSNNVSKIYIFTFFCASFCFFLRRWEEKEKDAENRVERVGCFSFFFQKGGKRCFFGL